MYFASFGKYSSSYVLQLKLSNCMQKHVLFKQLCQYKEMSSLHFSEHVVCADPSGWALWPQNLIWRLQNLLACLSLPIHPEWQNPGLSFCIPHQKHRRRSSSFDLALTGLAPPLEKWSMSKTQLHEQLCSPSQSAAVRILWICPANVKSESC